MEQFIKDQITSGLKYLPKNLAKSYFIKNSSAETKAFREKIGFIRGVCHPTDNYSQIKGANIEWIRYDIPYPFESDGITVRKCYENFKDRCKRFQANGIKVMAVTPNPSEYIEFGVDIRNPEHLAKIKEIAVFLAKDMQGVVSGFQVANEMGIPRFTLPVTLADAALFVGETIKAMHPVKGDIIVGYNSAGPEAGLNSMLMPYIEYCDYVGIDIYMGCFFNVPGFIWVFEALCRYLWAMTGKPILIQEFGYLSGGAPKTRADKKKILQKYGADSEKAARKDMETFLSNMPSDFAEHVKFCCENDPERYFGFLFRSDMVNHFYYELPRFTLIPGYPHTPKGQADFFTDCIERLYKLDFICGCNIYCYKDPDKCYYCGQKECPTETCWGLVDTNEHEKLSYKAVRNAFGRIKWLEAVDKK